MEQEEDEDDNEEGLSMTDGDNEEDDGDNEEDNGVPNEVGRGEGTGASADDVSTMTTYVDPRGFHSRFDFGALRKKMAPCHPDLQRSVEEAIKGLIAEVQDLVSRDELLNQRLTILTQGYNAKCGKGKKRFAKDMKGIDTINMTKIRTCINNIPDMILREGWHVYSEKETSFSHKFLRYSGVSVTAGFRGWRDYWENFLAPTISSQLGNRRNNLVQKIRRTWMCECMDVLSAFQFIVL